MNANRQMPAESPNRPALDWDNERLPGLSPHGCQRLQWLAEHPHGPLLRNRSGHRLTQADQLILHSIELQELDRWPCTHPMGTRLQNLSHRQFSANIGSVSSAPHLDNALPDWLAEFLPTCARIVPYYRQYLPASITDMTAFRAIPTMDRSDLSHDITRFVADDLPLDRMFKFTTSGTTGHSLTVPTHPLVAAQYSIFHQKALLAHSIDLAANHSEVAVMLAGFQQRCFTYLSVIPHLGERALLKLNFHPCDWRHPEDRGIFIDDIKPALVTGDPLSLHELAQLSFQHAPMAVLSTSMALTDGHQQCLQNRFKCPVIDIYSMNEAGPIGARVPHREGFRLLQSRLLVEILDEQGNVLPAGQRGEITLTGGFNSYLPLVRYRTGDHAHLICHDDGHWYLDNLEGRLPIRYRTQQGDWINNIEITHALQPFPLPQYIFHQHANGAVVLKVRGKVTHSSEIMQALQARLGAQMPVCIEANQNFPDKVIQYTSELPGAAP